VISTLYRAVQFRGFPIDTDLKFVHFTPPHLSNYNPQHFKTIESEYTELFVQCRNDLWGDCKPTFDRSRSQLQVGQHHQITQNRGRDEPAWMWERSFREKWCRIGGIYFQLRTTVSPWDVNQSQSR
jgi:hypothetical protein